MLLLSLVLVPCAVYRPTAAAEGISLQPVPDTIVSHPDLMWEGDAMRDNELLDYQVQIARDAGFDQIIDQDTISSFFLHDIGDLWNENIWIVGNRIHDYSMVMAGIRNARQVYIRGNEIGNKRFWR